MGSVQTRRNITLACKAWYAMGIEILYSHISIPSHLCDDLTAQQLVDKPQLLSHTKRLTVVPDDSPYLISVENMAWTARLCDHFPRLPILDAPGTILLSMPNQRLSSSLTVAIFRGRRGTPVDVTFVLSSIYPTHTPWLNIRVLKIDLDSLDLRTMHKREVASAR
jgi:hypothetical protein